jgi:hypothetical protein
LPYRIKSAKEELSWGELGDYCLSGFETTLSTSILAGSPIGAWFLRMGILWDVSGWPATESMGVGGVDGTNPIPGVVG